MLHYVTETKRETHVYKGLVISKMIHHTCIYEIHAQTIMKNLRKNLKEKKGKKISHDL